MTYDEIGRLVSHGLIERFARATAKRFTPGGLRIDACLTKLADRVLDCGGTSRASLTGLRSFARRPPLASEPRGLTSL
jgi:hypothetical protein